MVMSNIDCNRWRRQAGVARLLLVAALGLALAACTPTIDRRGYLPRQSTLAQVQVGMTKAQLESLLGSPSTTATIKFSGDSYYYISSTVEQTAFFKPKEVDRKVFAVRFDQNDQVTSFALYGLEDGQVININTRTTPTRGRELSVLQQIFGNIGKFDASQIPN